MAKLDGRTARLDGRMGKPDTRMATLDVRVVVRARLVVQPDGHLAALPAPTAFGSVTPVTRLTRISVMSNPRVGTKRTRLWGVSHR